MMKRVIALLLALFLTVAAPWAPLCASATETERETTGVFGFTEMESLLDGVTLVALTAEGVAIPEKTDGIYLGAKRIKLTYDKAVSGEEHAVFTLTMLGRPDDSNIVYINQATAVNGVVTFDIYPSQHRNQQYFIYLSASSFPITLVGTYTFWSGDHIHNESFLIHHDAKAPTCTEIGWDEYVTCSLCDYSTYVEIPALGHDPVLIGSKEVTCTEDGWNMYGCSRCDYTTSEKFYAPGHDYRVTVIPVTCESDGYTEHSCTRCGYNYTDQFVDALGGEHIWVERTTVAPTCLTEGEEALCCSRCQLKKKTASIPALGHDWSGWTHDDGTSGDGSEHRSVCSRCSAQRTGACEFITIPRSVIRGRTFEKHECPTCGYEFRVLTADSWIAGIDYSGGILTLTAADGKTMPFCLAAYDASGRMIDVYHGTWKNGKSSLTVGKNAAGFRWKLFYYDPSSFTPQTGWYQLEF